MAGVFICHILQMIERLGYIAKFAQVPSSRTGKWGLVFYIQVTCLTSCYKNTNKEETPDAGPVNTELKPQYYTSLGNYHSPYCFWETVIGLGCGNSIFSVFHGGDPHSTHLGNSVVFNEVLTAIVICEFNTLSCLILYKERLTPLLYFLEQ